MTREEVIKKIREELSKHENLEILEDSNSVRIEGDAFKVELVFEKYKYLLNLGQGWFIRSFSPRTMIEHFVKALSKEYRLIEFYRGRFYQKSNLEHMVDGKWRIISTTYRPFYPFWIKETSIVLQNNLI